MGAGFMVGVVSIVDADGVRVDTADENDDHAPVELQLGPTLVSSTSKNGALTRVTLDAAGGGGGTMVALDTHADFRALPVDAVTDGEIFTFAEPPGTFVYSTSLGAGVGDDDITTLKLTAVSSGSPGRGYSVNAAILPTFAALRLASSGRQSHVTVLSHASQGDKGEGFFAWVVGDTTADDNGTCADAGVGNARWKRQYVGPVDPRWFGARNDVVVCTDAVMTAGNAALHATLALSAAKVGQVVVVQAAKQNPMTGTFAVANGGTTVTGTGSNCSSETHLGMTVTIAGGSYEIIRNPGGSSENTDATHFYITPAFAGTTIASGGTVYLPPKPLITTMATYIDATHCTLSATPDLNVTAQCAMIGTDSTTAINTAFTFRSCRIAAGKYMTNIGLVAGLAGQEIYGEGRDASFLVSTSIATGGVILAQADRAYIHDLGFMGICVDDKTSQWAVLSDGVWPTCNGSGANFAAIDHTDFFTLSIDPLIAGEATGVVTITFTDADGAAASPNQAVIDRINHSFSLSADVAMRTNSSGTQLRLVSPNASTNASIVVGGSNATTLTRLGLTAGTYVGSGTAAKDVKIDNLRFTGPASGLALHNGVKESHGCHRWNVNHLKADQLCGSNGITGCGYVYLVAGCRDAQWDNISCQGSKTGGRHVVYNSGGAVNVKGGVCDGTDMNSSTYHLFSDWTEGYTRNVVVKQIVAVRQKRGEEGTGCAELTGVWENVIIEDIVTTDCVAPVWMASSYAYPAGLAKGLTIKNFSGTRNGFHGVNVRGAQRVRAKGVLVDPGWGTPASTYAGAHVQSNPDSGSNVIADDITLDVEVISSTPSAPLHSSVVRLEPSVNGPTNCDITALGHQGTSGLGGVGANGLFTYQVLPRKSNIRHRVPVAYTPGTAAPSVMGAKDLSLTQGGSGLTTLTNLTNGHHGQIVPLRMTDDLTIINDGGRFSLAYGTSFRSTPKSRIVFELRSDQPTATFTADNATDTMTATLHGLLNGVIVNVSNSGGGLPAGLAAATDYYVVGATANTFQLSATSGGSAINITTNGTGTQTFTQSPVWEEVSRVGGDAHWNSPATPARQQIRAQANNLGAIGMLAFGANNCAFSWDADWASSQWNARDTTCYQAYKNSGQWKFKGASGHAVNAAINFSDLFIVDHAANEWIGGMGVTTLPSDFTTDVLDTSKMKGNKVLTSNASATDVISTLDLPRPMTSDAVAVLQFTLLGYRTGGAAAGAVGDIGIFIRTVSVTNIGGTRTIKDTVDSYSWKTDAAWGDPIVINDGSAHVKIQAVGLAAAAITWSAEISMFRVRP